jgi:hypothetical protein
LPTRLSAGAGGPGSVAGCRLSDWPIAAKAARGAFVRESAERDG